ncbi:hypothetical protein [Streptomyces sp. NRRL S-350]|uniref:hypothetical protein n=1 Tax=Streptomyces sp. NRRL S-350 TaxID=1463902 RepID=UPI0004C1A8C5|nr:hypothetical protein [Streptomyces sp. NRRL S-350]
MNALTRAAAALPRLLLAAAHRAAGWLFFALGRYAIPQRPPARPKPRMATNGRRPRIPEQLNLDLLVASLMARSCACERWWTSCGTLHDHDCPVMTAKENSG